MDITVVTDLCSVGFDNADVVLAYVRALTHNTTPETFLQVVQAVQPEHLEQAKNIATTCLQMGPHI